MKRLTGKMRLAIFASVVWFVVWLLIGSDIRDIEVGVAVGGLPLLVVWGIWWVWQGFKKDKNE